MEAINIKILGVKYATFPSWEAGTVDTGINVESSAYILLFRCQTESNSVDAGFYSFIIPIAIGNARTNVWRGSSIEIKPDQSHPSSNIQFSISQGKTLLVTGAYGTIKMIAIKTL